MMRVATILAALLMGLAACGVGTGAFSASEAPDGAGRRGPSASPAEILGNPDALAFSYGGYRERSRDTVPTVEQLKDDMRTLAALGVKVIRTYNTQQYGQAANLLAAIDQLRDADPDFEMYVMLGAWIDCEGAWTPSPNHEAESLANNSAEIAAAVAFANDYPDIVKFIAVGNEAMVQWATSYFVRPNVILKWVEHLQGLKVSGGLPSDVWITSSDNYACWGGEAVYRTPDLEALIEAVDFVSLHTYPFHDTHYNPAFWFTPEEEQGLSVEERADAAVLRALDYAKTQYSVTAEHIKRYAVDKPIHIGETGWATLASTSYGATGSQAADEYKQRRYYEAMRDWTNSAGISCFYFEAFDEQWKDQGNLLGSENHFGLINLKGQAKYALWDAIDAGAFDGLTRDGAPITKTYGGDESALLADLLEVPARSKYSDRSLPTVNKARTLGDPVTEGAYVVLHNSLDPDRALNATYPSVPARLNVWEGTCAMEITEDDVIQVFTGTGAWWGCALELQGGGQGEHLGRYASGRMHFELRGDPQAAFELGFQTGTFAAGNQTNNFVTFGPEGAKTVTEAWASYSIPIDALRRGADLTDVTSVLFLRGAQGILYEVEVRNIWFER